MVQGTVANAGLVIRHLCDLGFEEDAVRHRVVAWCPQVLAMPQVRRDMHGEGGGAWRGAAYEGPAHGVLCCGARQAARPRGDRARRAAGPPTHVREPPRSPWPAAVRPIHFAPLAPRPRRRKR